MIRCPRPRRPNIAGTVPDVPRHVAIIMDGNGRWAAARGLPRVEGHRRGVEALRKTVRAAGEIGIGVPHDLLLLVGELAAAGLRSARPDGAAAAFIRNDLAELHGNGVRVRVIGERDRSRSGYPPPARRSRGAHARAMTSLMLVVAFNYGARDEIARAVRAHRRGRRERRAQARGDHRGDDRAASRRAGYRRSRSHHPHQRRAAAVEFPAVAGGLFGARVHCRSTGRISTARRSKPRSRNTAGASGASAGSPRKTGS